MRISGEKRLELPCFFVFMEVVKDFVGQPTPLLHAEKQNTLQKNIKINAPNSNFFDECFTIIFFKQELFFTNLLQS